MQVLMGMAAYDHGLIMAKDSGKLQHTAGHQPVTNVLQPFRMYGVA